jgi:hypothetical protein
VTDAVTGKPLARALVSIEQAPAVFRTKLDLLAQAQGASWPTFAERPDKTLTRNDGLFWFLDLPEGRYSLTVGLPAMGSRYGKLRQNVAVTREAKGNARIVMVNFAVPPTGLRGKVTAAGRKTPVAMAEVRVKSSGEYAYTDDQGQYALLGIESGKRTVLVIAQGYKSKEQVVKLEKPGASQLEDFNLARETG